MLNIQMGESMQTNKTGRTEGNVHVEREREREREKNQNRNPDLCAGPAHRVLLTTGSDSWNHSTMGGGSAVNWQWKMASPFRKTTWSSGLTTGRGKLLSEKKPGQEMILAQGCEHHI